MTHEEPKTTIRQGMTLAGTGHRPNRLGGYSHNTYSKLRTLADKVVREYQPFYGYCGGALGWDTAWGEALMKAGIPYCLALPGLWMGSNWKDEQVAKLDTLKENADKVISISPEYSPKSYIIRDRYMVIHSEGVVALLNPTATSSGSYITCAYAAKLNRPILHLWDQYSEL